MARSIGPSDHRQLNNKCIYMVRMFHSQLSGESPVARADTLLEVRKAEEEAERIIKEAQERQKAIVAAARKRVLQRSREAEEKLKAEIESTLSKEKKSVASQKEEILSKGRTEAAKIRKQADERVPKVKNHLKDSFERAIDAAAGANG
ncbi:MAG: hypothetical protein FJ151_04450 [Euryarchaeota archaeon]|nr:hypothetical protein [Euryarchaeota archaeon]